MESTLQQALYSAIVRHPQQFEPVSTIKEIAETHGADAVIEALAEMVSTEAHRVEFLRARIAAT